MEAAMVDWKKYRESIGYTQAKVSKDAKAWHALAFGYHRAAELLNEFPARVPRDTRQFAFNAAISIELILKAILARKLIDIPNRFGGHDLLALSDMAVVRVSENQRKTLDLLTATIIWSGRYPAPNTEAKWDEYQDFTFESHVIRTKRSTMANRDTFPDWNNYSKIWAICIAEFQAASKK
jgi:HEPN domain-containing protein